MNLGSDVVITITGIVLVFAILILLMLIITLEGKIFDGMAAKKKAAKEPAAPKAAAKPAAPVQQAAPAPVVEEGIPGDVVAAIMAAIHAMGSRIRGSNSFTMARYSRKQPTQIIIA